MEDLDSVTAVKASLEMLIMDNDDLIQQFSKVVSELDEIGKLPKKEKYARFHQMEKGGAFSLNGVDIRLFAKSTHKPLPPVEFLARTLRRLKNTSILLGEFVSKGLVEEGSEFQTQLQSLISEPVDVNENDAVIAFKNNVETLRGSEQFVLYQKNKTTFLKQDSELKAESDYLATKESIADGAQVAQAKNDELQGIQEKLDLGELSPDVAQELLDEMEESAK